MVRITNIKSKNRRDLVKTTSFKNKAGMDGSRTHHGSYQPDTDFEDQEAHRDLTIPAAKYIRLY